MKSSISRFKFFFNREFTLWLCWTLLVLPAAGVEIDARSFVKMHVGPFYVLEAFFLAWFLSALMSRGRDALLELPQRMPSLWAFVAWGVILTLAGFVRHPEAMHPPLCRRVTQHMILFVYPMMWMSAGAWLWRTDRILARGLLWIIFLITAGINVLKDFGYSGYLLTGNISIGPLLTLTLPLLLDFAIDERADRFQRWPLIALWLVVSGLTCWPFWQMWRGSAQRTSLLLFFVLLSTLPFVLHRRAGSWLRTGTLLAVPFLYFTAGIFVLSNHLALPHWPRFHFVSYTTNKTVTPVAPSPPPVPKANRSSATPIRSAAKTLLPERVDQHILKVMRHGEDIPADPNSRRFEFRTRGFMWKMAIAQWLLHPIVGVGFLPEVPNYVFPGLANEGGFTSINAPPVSGPHNSYLSILTRMGLIGSGLFLWLLLALLRQANLLIRLHPRAIPELLLLYIPFNGAIHAFFNVGFESPHHCMILWLTAGMLMVREDSIYPKGARS